VPIKPELRWFYPIDWPQISHWVRFVRAKGAARSGAGHMVRSCGIWAMAAGGTRCCRAGGTVRVVGSPHLPSWMWQCGPPRWCWRQLISIIILAAADRGTAMSEHSANAAICSTTGRSIGGGSG
jgi:hypothetical protein